MRLKLLFGGFGLAVFCAVHGGKSWTRPVNIFTAFDTCNYFEPSIGRCVEDGVAGARSDLSSAPSVDIANGAPTGTDATDELVLTWVDGQDGLNNEHVLFTSSSAGGSDWEDPGRAGWRPRLLFGPGDLTERDGRVARVQRLHHDVPGKRGGTRQ